MRLLCDVCWGLEHAHINGFIHRDIKPANILCGNKGEGKLSDFGLATRAAKGDTASPNGYLTHLAPEVLTQGVTSAASDMYALGVTAYRLINGDGFLPQVGGLAELQDMIIGGDYPQRNHYRPYVPPRLKSIVNKCMELDPQRRYPSASALRRDLEKLVILCDWKWRRRGSTVSYSATIDQCCLEVQVIQPLQPRGKFEIRTTRGVNKKRSRSVKKDSLKGLTCGQMKTSLRKILTRYVLQGK
jgi:eukaryotic-like serine/threonine-protein kinase